MYRKYIGNDSAHPVLSVLMNIGSSIYRVLDKYSDKYIGYMQVVIPHIEQWDDLGSFILRSLDEYNDKSIGHIWVLIIHTNFWNDLSNFILLLLDTFNDRSIGYMYRHWFHTLSTGMIKAAVSSKYWTNIITNSSETCSSQFCTNFLYQSHSPNTVAM